MAPQAKAPVKAKKAPVAKVATKVKAKPKGLILSSAQWKAYNKAFAATARAAALTAASNRFRKYRLQAAYSTIKAANVATHNAQVSAIAAFAEKTTYRQSGLAHQNKALRARLEVRMYNAATLAGRAQYIQGGVKAYAQRAVMRTVDAAQAKTHEQAVFAAAARAAKAGKKSTGKKRGRPTKAGAAINAQAAAAGLKAAKAVKSPKAPKAKGRPKGSKGTKGKVKAVKANSKAGAQSAKAPVVKAKSRTAPYQGFLPMHLFDGKSNEWGVGLNDFEGTCIMAAVANALWHQTGWRLPDEDIAYWTGRAGPHPTIGGVLNMLWVLQPWPQVELLQPIPLVANYEYFCDRILGIGDHAAYAFGAQMASYGELVPVVDADEVCTLEFESR